MKLDLREKLPRMLNRAYGPDERTPLIGSATIRKVFDVASLVLFFYFVTQFFWPAPLGVIVQGAVVGGLTAMISFGMVLIYRANRIVNFAQGDMGGEPAALMVLLIASGWPYFIAVVIGLAAAVVLGTVVETLIIRRFFKSPRLILTVATIGLSQILAGVAVSLPRAFDFTVPPQSFPSPFDFAFEIKPIIFRGNHILAMMAIAAAIVGLAAFFRYTNIGIAVRASAESTDRAFLLGIPVKRVHTIVWVVAALLATVAMFLRAGIMGLPFGRVLAPAILLRALAAAVMGRMERLPTVFFAAISIGIIEQSIIWHNGNSNFTAPILFVVVLVGLLAQRKGEAKRTEEGSSWQALKEIRRIPRELKNLPEVKWVVRAFVGLFAAFLLT
ncbi:MAG: branched-chain amino acid ABC transporter permease, partial [Acidimicrobiia bacterium]